MIVPRQYSISINVFTEVILGTLGRFLNFLAMIYASKVFGASKDTDVIYYAIAVTIAVTCIFNAANSSIILPQFLIAQRERNDSEAWVMVRSIFTISVIFLSFVMLFGFFWFPDGLFVISHFAMQDIQHLRYITPILVMSLFAAYVADLMATIFRGYRNFVIPNVAFTVGTATGLGVYLLFGDILGSETIALSYLIVWLVQAVILWLALLKHKSNLWLHLGRFQRSGTVLRLIPPLLLNQLSAVIVMLFPIYMASKLEGGDLTALAYARRLFDLVPGLVILPIVTAMAPMLSDAVANGQGSETGARIHKVNSVLFAVVLPISVFVLLHADLIAAVVFGSRTYSETHQALTADAMRWYFVGLMALASNAVITRTLELLQSVRMAYASLVFAFAPALGVPVLVKLGVDFMGSIGVAVGYTAYLILVHQTLGYAVWRNTFSGFDIQTELLSIVRPILISLLSGVLTYTLYKCMLLPSLLHLIVSCITFIVFYIFLHAAINSPEFIVIKNKLYGSHDETKNS